MINQKEENMLCGLAELFRVFGDSTRIKILHSLLVKGEMNVSEIASFLSMTQPAISQQLRFLRVNSLVKSRREGKTVIYSLSDSHVKEIIRIGIEHFTEDKHE